MANGNSPTGKSPFLHAVNEFANGLFRSSGFALDDNRALFACSAIPTCLMPLQGTGHFAHAAVFNKIVEGGKRKKNLGSFKEGIGAGNRLVKINALSSGPFKFMHAKNKLGPVDFESRTAIFFPGCSSKCHIHGGKALFMLPKVETK